MASILVTFNEEGPISSRLSKEDVPPAMVAKALRALAANIEKGGKA